MSDFIKQAVLGFMCVPADPHIPEGSPGSAQVFRAGRNFYRWTFITWALTQLVVVCSLAVCVLTLETRMHRYPPAAQTIIHACEFAAIAFLAAFAIVTYFQLRLNYELRWYIVTDRSLRIRSGIVSVQELTLTFANIQEIRVSAGPLQVLLGLADVEVRTAGGSAAPGVAGGAHIGRFEGVDNANAIRDLIVERLRIYRDSGLGERTETSSPKTSGTLQAAQTLLAETRALRATLLKS